MFLFFGNACQPETLPSPYPYLAHRFKPVETTRIRLLIQRAIDTPTIYDLQVLKDGKVVTKP